jgi:hypothetical protein
VLQKYLKLAFGDAFRVFVSSDAKSIGGGEKWYPYIIENLRLSEIILVLVSQESKGREWINFEAGFGEGLESLVIPIGINNISLGQLSYPLAGFQARSIDNIDSILEDTGNRIRMTPGYGRCESVLSRASRCGGAIDLPISQSSACYSRRLAVGRYPERRQC